MRLAERHFKKIFLVLSFLFVACANTPFLEDFKHLRLGMDHADVLERLGTPIRQERHEDKDWWYYSGYQDGIPYERMVVFKNDQLIYAGRTATPRHIKSADQADREIQRKNESLELEDERARAEAVRIPSGPSPIQEPGPDN